MTPPRPNRVLAVYLDGYEPSLGDRFMDEGRLPALAGLRQTSARFQLDHGSAQHTGLAGEHFSTGLSPDDAQRWAAVSFDKQTYEVWQDGTTRRPFLAGRDIGSVVFDPTYFDLDQAGKAVQGLVNWGAHDPGIAAHSRPDDLLAELTERFGPYPATPWLYGHVWPSPRRTAKMADSLVQAAQLRARASTWLLNDRLPNWQLGIVVSRELHSATEALWHGIDSSHPLNNAPSAAAGQGLTEVYQAVDGLVGAFKDSFPDATLLVFTLGGMGPNRSDLASMALLPELLYRRTFGGEHLQPQPEWQTAADGVPFLEEDQFWARAMIDAVPRTAAEQLDKKARKKRRSQQAAATSREGMRLTLDWMPAARYGRFWPQMDAFALPSFYDGRVRINLAGREREGQVPLAAYEAKVQEIEDLVRDCIDPLSGESAVAYVEKLAPEQALNADPTASDLTIIWRGTAQALTHPTLGKIGRGPSTAQAATPDLTTWPTCTARKSPVAFLAPARPSIWCQQSSNCSLNRRRPR